MNSFLTGLKTRELYILSGALILLLLSLFSFLLINLYNSYSLSLKNLNKEKIDYEYVYAQSKVLTQIPKSVVVNKDLVNELVENGIYSNVTNIVVDQVENKTIVLFSSPDIQNILLLVEELINSSSMNVESIEFINLGTTFKTEVIFI
jgi:hypothetical protein|tara:strand:+ start:1658 stop:2101 length:444 start_codon:yes stop_codon:yes gene_type:complete